MRGVRKTGDVSCIAWRWRGLIMFSAHRSQVRCELRRSAARNQDMYILYATKSRSTGSRTQPSYATQIPRTSGSGGGAPRFTGAASLLRVGSLRRATRDSNRSTREAARAQWECMAGASQLDLTAELSCRIRQTSSVTKRTHRERHRCRCSCAAHSRRDELRRDRASWLGYCSITALLSSSRHATRWSCLAQACSTITQLLESMPPVSPCFLPMHASPTC